MTLSPTRMTGQPPASSPAPSRDPPFELLLFGHDEQRLAGAYAAGVAGAIVDWETEGKVERQAGADTQINHDTPEDLRRLRKSFSGPILCRINPIREHRRSGHEIDQAIDGGANEILLPMVKAPSEVEWALDYTNGKVGVGMLVETVEAVEACQELGRLPLSRVYVGLNDLAIARRSEHIFAALADGTVDRLRRYFTVPFGFGGLTVVESGHPIPCRVLMSEMVRFGCSFSFLRRSFVADMANRDPGVEVPRILAAIARMREEAHARGPATPADFERYPPARIMGSR